MSTILPVASIVGSGTSQADDLHTDMTFDLASSGFGLHYEIVQSQGQSRTKAGSLTEEVVIGGRSRSQEATTNLWVNFAGYGNWTETNTSGWSESVSNYEFSRRIDKSYWYGRQSYQVSPVSYGRTSNWTSSGSSDRYGPADPYAGGSYHNAIFNPETGMVDYAYADASSPGSDPTGDHGYSEYEGVFESGTAHDLAEWNVTFSNPMSLINQALAPYNYYNLPFIPQAFTNAMGGYEPSYLGDWHLSSEGWASDTQYYKYYENDRTGDWRIDYWDHKPAENETPQRSEYGGPSYDSIQQETYAAQQQAQSQANQTPPDEAPPAKSADQNRLEEEQSASGSEGGSYTPSTPVAPGNEVGQASRNAMDRAYERLAEQQSNPHIRDLLNRNEHDLGTLINRAPYRPSVDAPVLQEVGFVKKPSNVREKTANGVDIETLPAELRDALKYQAKYFQVTDDGRGTYSIKDQQGNHIGTYRVGRGLFRSTPKGILTLPVSALTSLRYSRANYTFYPSSYDDLFTNLYALEQIGTEDEVVTEADLMYEYIRGFKDGLLNDGIGGTVSSLWEAAQIGIRLSNPGIIINEQVSQFLWDPKAYKNGIKKNTEIASRIASAAPVVATQATKLMLEIQSINFEIYYRLFKGEEVSYETLPISPELRAATEVAREFAQRAVAHIDDPKEKMYWAGRIYGNILFEFATAL